MLKRPRTSSPLEAKAREFVVRLRDYFERECQNQGPLLPYERPVMRVAEALGISPRTVSKITKEKYGKSGLEDNILKTPSKRKHRACVVTNTANLDVAAIRKHIDDYHVRNETPSISKLCASLRDANLYKGSRGSLPTLLKRIGINHRICDTNQGEPMIYDKRYENIATKLEDPLLSHEKYKDNSNDVVALETDPLI